MKSFQLAENKSLLKFLLIMKLTAVFILFFVINASADGFGQQKLNLKFKKTEIADILITIEKQTNYRFLYNNDLADLKQKVNLSVKDAELKEVLDAIFAKTDLAYQFMENNLVVIKEAGNPEASYELQATVTGKVTGEGDSALSGVSVQIKGTNKGATTNAQGVYSINATENDVLVFSYVGYETQEQAVGNKTEINVALVAAKTNLEQVVVIGYGTASKRDLTGSIVKIAGKEIADKPNVNPVASLQGKVAGLSVVNNGNPGQAPDIRIRGTISIGSVHPLYVVDGIFNDNIDFLNPNDIESIEILKDPSSLAIFGVKGAAGVIAITTKQAKAGQTVINVNSTVGFKKLIDKIELASGDDFRKIFAQEAANGLNDPDPTIGSKNTTFANNEMASWTGNTDWIDVLTRTAMFNTNNLSLSSSTDRNKFYTSIGYTKDEGLMKHAEYKRLNLTFNDEARLFKTFKVGVNLIGSKEDLPYGSGELDEARRTLPIINSDTKTFFAVNPYGTDSANYNVYEGVPVIQNTEHNPLMVIENEWSKLIDKRYRVVGSVYAELNFLKDFTARATFYGDISNEDKRSYVPLYYSYSPVSADPLSLFHKTTSLTQEQYNARSYQADYTLTYKHNFNGHSVTALIGGTDYYNSYYYTKASTQQLSGYPPIPDDKRFWYISSGFGQPGAPSSDQHVYTTVSGLARVLYNYQNKYYINASYRRDAASNISKDYSNKWQSFWAVGAAWELTKESFMQNQKIFDFLKIKGSAGLLGNFNTGTIGGYYPAYPGLNYSNAQFGVTTVPIANPDYLPDPNLHWEEVYSQEVGFEFTALNNRLHGDVVYYNKNTKGLLALLKPSGVLPTLTNSGEINNKGFEFSASLSQPLGKDFSFSVSGNLTTYKNRILKLTYPTGLDPQFPNEAREGYPIGAFFGYVVEGLYQSYADILKSPISKVNGGGAQPGDFKYKDISGPDGKPDGVVDEADQTFIGNPSPNFSYGGTISLNYKGLGLDIDVSGVYGNEVYRYWSTSEQKNSVYNYPKYYLNAWHGEGTSNWVPIVDAQHLINRVPSTYGIEDGSYFRIRTITLGYNFSSKLLRKAYIKGARLFASVQNLKTFKNNMGYSPEYGGTGYNTAYSFGIDYGNSDGMLPRVVSFGLNVSF